MISLMDVSAKRLHYGNLKSDGPHVQVGFWDMNAKVITFLFIVFILHKGCCQYCYTGIQEATVKLYCPSETCLKHVTEYDNTQAVVYSCSLKSHDEGCRRDESPVGYIENCYCKGNLCNGSGAAAIAFHLLLGSFLLNMFL
ncbi:uncharacterized protein [Macrobrachium rosenbergii]|uniref:uncharacterized protein n=1 Tax=Macrobrachium rosenbergii TaxID=79674 RepID=UPI0034D5AC82